jgi:hypothetical protein
MDHTSFLKKNPLNMKGEILAEVEIVDTSKSEEGPAGGVKR